MAPPGVQQGRALSRTPSDKSLGAFGQRRPSATSTAHARRPSGGQTQTAQIPSAGQLNELLRSLNAQTASAAGSPPVANAEAGPSRTKSRTLIEPFGPIGALTRPSITPTRSGGSDEALTRRGSGSYGHGVDESRIGVTLARTPSAESAVKGKIPERGAGCDTMPLSKALPVISELLEKPSFVSELKKVSNSIADRVQGVQS